MRGVSMDYYRKIMSYAELIQMWGEDTDLIARTLEEKLRSVNLTDSDKLAFWTEVVGRIHRNSVYVEITEVFQLENILTATIPSVPDIFKMINSLQMKTWYKRFYEVYDVIQSTAEYQSNLTIKGEMTSAERKNATLMALQFFNEALKERKPINELFKYLGLLKISIEGLVHSNQLHESFIKFLYNVAVPIFRAQRKIVMEFIDLVENEHVYTANEKARSGLELSKVFNRSSEPAINIINLSVPPLDEEVDEHGVDKYLGSLSSYLVDLFHDNSATYYLVNNIDREWKRNPIGMFFKFQSLAEALDIDMDTYVIPVSPYMVLHADNVLYSQIKLYGEQSLLDAACMELHNLIIKYQKLGEQIKLVCISEWSQMWEPILNDIQSLVRLGFVTAHAAEEAIKTIKAKGELHGLHVHTG